MPRKAGREGAVTPLLVLCTAAMAVSVTHTYAVGPLAPFWSDDLGLSEVQIGVVSAVIVAVAGVGSLLAGRLGDRRGGGHQLVTLFVAGALGLLGMGLAPSFPWLLVGAAVGGLCQALANPSTNLLIAERVPRDRQPMVIGVKQSGVQIPALISGLLFPVLALRVGWRPALVVLGVACLLGVPATRRIAGTAAGLRSLSTAGAPRPLTRAERGFVLGMTAYSFFMGVGVNAFVAYAPTYAVTLGTGVVAAGSIVAVVGACAVVGRLLWAKLGERRPALGMRGLLLLAIVAMGCPLLMLLAPVAGSWTLWAAGALHGATASSWNALGMLLLVGTMERDVVGRATGMVQSGYLGGLLVSPLLMAGAIAATGGYAVGWWGLGAAFVAAAVVAAKIGPRSPGRQPATAGAVPLPPRP